MKESLIASLAKAVVTLGLDPALVALEYPENPDHGDFSTNIALAAAKQAKVSPKALAENVVAAFEKVKPDFIESVSVAGPGFINFKVKDREFADEIVRLADNQTAVSDGPDGSSSLKHFTSGKRRFPEVKRHGSKGDASTPLIMVEYTDPNPFKVFHIGHLMSNAIGESISRLIEYSGADVKRANWQGDVGPHVAKAIWGAMNSNKPALEASTKTDDSPAGFWGKAYVKGAEAYENDPKVKKEIEDINKKVYDRSDSKVNEWYDRGRKESLDAFEIIYKRLGTKFDSYFFEGTEGRNGEAIVREHLKDGIFKESEGAIIFKGEDHGLHTRVFITSKGLPTYETKEIGLNIEKFKLYPDLNESLIITGNEQSDYFKVLLKVFELIRPEIASKTKHMSHGLMRFASGKMSSRTGNVISAEALIDDIKAMVMEKMIGREFSAIEADEISDMIAIAAIKYTILRQGIGGDVIFDSAKSISFEGDSGPYLQYSAVRAQSVLAKAEKEAGSREKGAHKIALPEKVGLLEQLIVRFPDIAERARQEYAPQHVANYLINLAGAFNAFYGNSVIVDVKEPLSPYRIELTRAFLKTMTDGLWLLGIKVPRRM